MSAEDAGTVWAISIQRISCGRTPLCPTLTLLCSLHTSRGLGEHRAARMDDEDASFAQLLSSTSTSRPTWTTTAPSPPDPWGNPFAESNPFAGSASPFGSASTYQPAATVAYDAQVQEDTDAVSPYVRQLEADRERADPALNGFGQSLSARGDEDVSTTVPAPPSVLAAREQAALASAAQDGDTGGFGGERMDDPFGAPFGTGAGVGAGAGSGSFASFEPPLPSPALQSDPTQPPPRKALPSALIDEEIMEAADPSASLKKAFVKSETTRPAQPAPVAKDTNQPYVFRPSGAATASTETSSPTKAKSPAKAARPVEPAGQKTSSTTSSREPSGETEDKFTPAPSSIKDKRGKPPASIPLPDSVAGSPSISRTTSPLPPTGVSADSKVTDSHGLSPAVPTATSYDRVSVSPLDAPAAAQEDDYGFKGLSVGASGAAPAEPSSSGWSSDRMASSSSSRFAGKGWGALDEEEDNGLFGRGGPAVKTEGWGEDARWGEPGPLASSSTGPSRLVSPESSVRRSLTLQPSEPPSDTELNRSGAATPEPAVVAASTQAPTAKPLFSVSVGDPAKVGDPVRGYTVYTVRTRTSSPHFSKTEMTVLRRFSDFLWLYESLINNNPGVIVPPMPDKNTFGRFQDQFIETRRQALERALRKITSHPVLQLDPDLRLFLETDNFASEAKIRRIESPVDKSGLLANFTGPKYVEQDEWFESRRTYLDHLEGQLKGLSKAIDQASRARLDMAAQITGFADSITALAESDLGSAMCAALARLADLARREKETNEELAKQDVVYLLNMSDEYVRFIGSVRTALASRIKNWQIWQDKEKEVNRLKNAREKARQQGKLGDRAAQSLAEIGDVSFFRVIHAASANAFRRKDGPGTLRPTLRASPSWSRASLHGSSASGWTSSSACYRRIWTSRSVDRQS